MTFATREKIDCSMMIIVKAVADNLYTCEMQLQSRRPVYNTSYTTPLINFKDNNFNFTYQEFERIEYQQNQFTTNLTAMLAYYCYLVIGYDMDSYSRLGGTPYFQTCEDIVSACQSASMESLEQKECNESIGGGATLCYMAYLIGGADTARQNKHGQIELLIKNYSSTT